MSEGPQLEDVSEDANEPATKADVGDLAAMTARSFAGVEKRFDTTENRLDRLKQGQKAMLAVLKENNQLLNEMRRLPERVDRLERSVFRR